MAKQPTQALVMPDGNEYEFFGKTYYGVCSTAASTAAKTVSITGFNSNSLVAGVRVIIAFRYGHDGNSQPTLRINNSDNINHSIYIRHYLTDDGTSGHTKYPYNASYSAYLIPPGMMLPLIYDGNYWVIENTGIADATYYGVTKLTTSTTSTDETSAATPYSVKQAYDHADTLIAGLDSSVSATAASGNAYSVLTGVTETDGKLTAKTEVTLSAVAKTGAASDMSVTDTAGYFDASTVEGALAEIGEALADSGASASITLNTWVASS